MTEKIHGENAPNAAADDGLQEQDRLGRPPFAAAGLLLIPLHRLEGNQIDRGKINQQQNSCIDMEGGELLQNLIQYRHEVRNPFRRKIRYNERITCSKEKAQMIYTVTFNPSLDYIVSVPEFKLGKTNRTQEENITAGGKGINVSLVLTALGIPNTALGFTAGFVGEEIRRQLKEKQICCDFLTLPEGCSRINVKLKNLEGTEINGRGPAIDEASLSILKGKISRLSDHDILVLSGSIPSGMSKTLYAELMQLLPETVKVVVDAAGETLLHTLPLHPFLIKPNRDELAELLPESPSGNLKLCAARLQQLGARNVLISMAGDGAALLDENGEWHQHSAPDGTLVNGVGAGDSMVAGFLAGYLQAGSSEEAFQKAFLMGLAAGSASAYQEGLAGQQDIRKLYDQLANNRNT